MTENKPFSKTVAKNLLENIICNYNIYKQVKPVLEPDFFYEFSPIVKFLHEYSEKYNGLPAISEIEAEFAEYFVTKKIWLADLSGEADAKNPTWLLDKTESFCKHRAMSLAIVKANEILTEKDDQGSAFDMIEQAYKLSVLKAAGLSYWENISERLKALSDSHARVSCGWKTVDEKIGGGVSRGELMLFAGSSGTGKSICLQNIAVNFNILGYNVLFVTLELYPEYVYGRIDSMFTGIPAKQIVERTEEVASKLEMKKQQLDQSKNGRGHMECIYLPSGSTMDSVDSMLQIYEDHFNIKFDCLVIDYLDLMSPRIKVDMNNVFLKDKLVSEEMRSFVKSNDMFCFSASQLNRQGATEDSHNQSMIAGGISKINTCDNLITIYSNNTMRQNGEYQFQFQKTRSSDGVGSKLIMGFNPTTLRIFDLDEQPPTTSYGLGGPNDQGPSPDTLGNLQKTLAANKGLDAKPLDPAQIKSMSDAQEQLKKLMRPG